jgi:hypothetical protein
MLRSAAAAGVSIADAGTNANNAVLAHSHLVNQPRLDAFRIADKNTRRPDQGPSAWAAAERISGTCGACATRLLFPTVF